MLNRILVVFALSFLGSQAEAGMVGAQFQVNTLTKDSQREPSITPLANGGFVVTWDSRDDARQGIHAQIYDAAGARLGREFQISINSTMLQWSPAVAALGDGGFVVAWVSGDGSANDIFARRYDATGRAKTAEIRINTSTRGDQNNPSIAGLKDGGFVVIWDSLDEAAAVKTASDIFGQRYSATGSRVGGQFTVSKLTNDQQFPKVAGLSNGGFVVTWLSNHERGTGGVFGQRYTATGASSGAAFRINRLLNQSIDLYYHYPSVAGLKDGGFVFIWEGEHWDPADAGIYGQRYSANGLAAGAEFRANTGSFKAADYGDAGSHSAVAPLANGGFVAIWRSEWDGIVYGQRFTSSGQRSGVAFAAGKRNSGNGQRYPVAAGLRNGGFVATWTDDDMWGKQFGFDGIFGQRFNP